MDNAFDHLVAVCERMRHLTGALETIRNLLMADVMTTSDDARTAMGDTQETARSLFIHAVGLRQRAGTDLETTVTLITSDTDPAHSAQRQEWLTLCGDLAGTLQSIDAVLAELEQHFRR
ncbi:MAG: hypothetical protein KF871_05725 [Hydrogenophaga sp.]|uniref:hypothetical protein n=1 Tax=Hydrogenophaga sp. TaxID=1904254 RepID=UPI001D9A6660|nr:hypothetical protein [Hydrogenophaga sp.]MBX3609378.1 hypothetical protein [Hydrogenophaga sp.]